MLHSLFTSLFASAILLSSQAGHTAPAQKVTFTTMLPVAASTSAASKVESEKEDAKPTPTVQPTVEVTDIPVTMPAAVIPTENAPVATEVPNTISDEALAYLGNCEAGNNPARNSGNGYYGAFQFSYGTWKSLNTGFERADLAPLEVQRAAVKQLLQRSSIYNQFPGCARKMRSERMI